MFFHLLFASNRRRSAPATRPGYVEAALNPLVYLCRVRM